MKEPVFWGAAGFVNQMTKTFKIITLGCKVNQYESAYLKSRLQEAGWVSADPHEKSNVSIVNTCIVTQAAAHQSRQEIRKAIRANPGGYVAATGCYAQAFPDKLQEIENLDLITGNVGKMSLPELIRENLHSRGRKTALEPFTPGMGFETMSIKRFPGRSRAYLKIQDGCEAYCSYCIVPFSRGPYRSLPPENVLGMLEGLAAEGYLEVVLTGIHLGKYGVDLAGDKNLKTLLRAIGRAKFPLRVRVSSMEPGEIDTELIEMVASEEWLCRHFHIPLQSGDDGILKKMNRRYAARAFERLVEEIHEKIPLAAIGVDVMAGFPGEEPGAHSNTVSLLKALPVSYLHVFPYSRRSGTAAARFSDAVLPQDRKKRAAALRALGKEKKRTFQERCLGRVFEVLAEGWHSEDKHLLNGTTDNYLSTLFPALGPGPGRLVKVRLEKVEKQVVTGRQEAP
jgi:threonylcarbamoyladenosine tRNA methylthiotransferase MtaB